VYGDSVYLVILCPEEADDCRHAASLNSRVTFHRSHVKTNLETNANEALRFYHHEASCVDSIKRKQVTLTKG